MIAVLIASVDARLTNVVLPNDARVSYVGRFDFDDPLAPTHAWAATQVSVNFRGTEIAANLSAPKDGERLRIIIDGNTSGFVLAKQGGALDEQSRWSTYTLARELPSGEHFVTVWKATEDNSNKGAKGVAGFGGFATDGVFLERAAVAAGSRSSRTRRLQFIGDSDTAGWCADGEPSTGDAANKYEDSYQTWAAQLARAFDAELHVQAVSGWGVGSGAKAIQTVMDYTNGFAKQTLWNYSQWTPDAIVLLIGPNDESRSSHNRRAATPQISRRGGHRQAASTGAATRSGTPVSGGQFIADYIDLLDRLVENYAAVAGALKPKIVHVCGGSLNGFDPCDDIETANGRFNAKHGAAGWSGHFTTIKRSTWETINGCKQGSLSKCSGKSAFNGCDGHYNANGHMRLAADVRPQIAKVLGW
jgi:hypothetical protein